MNKKIDSSESQPILPKHAILKKHREKLGLTQQQVADIASINIRQYQRFESGERRISGTSFRIGVAIADILELDVHELVYNHTVEEYLKRKKKWNA